MELRDAIGIDPDSKGFVCATVRRTGEPVTTKRYLSTQRELTAFLSWVKEQADLIVAIEGSHGLSSVLEESLRQAGRIFYSFKPADTDKFRKAVLGQNKDNHRDAESVARYAMALEAQGKLERYRRVWFADSQLQLLTRCAQRISQSMTAELNRLWKLIRYACPELCLALSRSHPQVHLPEKALKSQGILTLLTKKPDFSQWGQLSEPQWLQAMGGGKYKGRQQLLEQLGKLSGSFAAVSPALALLIRNSAQQIQRYKAQQAEIIRMLEELTSKSGAVQALRQIRGIGTRTAATLVAEIIDIRRFPGNDSLACYSGLGMKTHATGESFRLLPTRLFNHRLKDAFMTAARNFVLHNPQSHLAGYHRNLRKRGLSATQATKRVARALVRVIFRTLSAQLKAQASPAAETQDEKGEGYTANGLTRSERSRISNISPSSRLNSKPVLQEFDTDCREVLICP